MSTLYVESNKESAKELFDKRTIYNLTADASVEYTNLVDFNFGEKFLYGRVKRAFIPMTLNAQILNLKNLPSTTNISAVNFVANAYNDFVAAFNKLVAMGKASADETYLSNLRAYKGWQDPGALYSAHLTSYANAFAAGIEIKDIKIKDFSEFIKEYETFIIAGAHRLPFTKPGFVKSRLCPITCSGLAVEIADLDPSNDEEKIDNFIESPNWGCYVSLANSYGFMVDRFVPWRLVADIASPAMLEYAKEQLFSSTDMILNIGYTAAHNKYFLNFKYYLLNLYNTVTPKSFLETEECNGTTSTKIITRQNYSMEKLSKLYSEEFFLKLYFKTRFIEEESVFKDFEREMLIDDCIEIYQNQNVFAALNVFETILNKPFDYRGSLGYIIEQVAARSAEPI